MVMNLHEMKIFRGSTILPAVAKNNVTQMLTRDLFAVVKLRDILLLNRTNCCC